jgi:hypothetical protein
MAYVTLGEAKDHIRVDYTDDDVYITDLISVCETAILNEVKGHISGEGTVTALGTALTGSGTNFLDFKAGDIIKVDGESRTIGSITSNTTLTVTAAFTSTSSGLSFVIEPSPVVNGALPAPLKQAVLIMIGLLYNQREPVIVGASVVKTPYTLEYLIAPYKSWVVK